MKQPPVSSLVLFFSGCLLLSACSKGLNDVVYDRKEALPALLESARIWYLQHKEPESPSVKRYGQLPGYWRDSRIVKTNDGSTLLIVPAASPPAENKNLTFERFLVFRPSGSMITAGKIVELLGKKYNVASNSAFLLKNQDQNNIPGFNGAILQYDVNYQPLTNASHESGQKIANTSTSIIRIAGKEMGQIKQARNLSIPISVLEPGRYQVHQQIYTLKGMAPYKSLLVETNDSITAGFSRNPGGRTHLQSMKFSIPEPIMDSFIRTLGSEPTKALSSETGKRNILVTLYMIARKGEGKLE